MSDIRTSFAYDPARQGYDTNSWRTISGAPAVTGTGRFVVDAGVGTTGAAIHYADFLKGDISFNVNIDSISADGDLRRFGVATPSSSNYIYFEISNGSLTCRTSSDLLTTVSSAIAWDSNWDAVNTIFRIRWEAGTAKFFVNGSQVYAISDASVPPGTMSLYLLDNSDTAMTIGEINVKGTQSFVMNPKTSDSTSNIPAALSYLTRSESVTITENVSLLIPTLHINEDETVTITENVSLLVPTIHINEDETVTITEDVANTIV